MACTIYKITNTTNGHAYMGQTWQSLRQRWAEHRTQNRKSKLRDALRSYGHGSFTIERVAVCSSQSVADYLENHYINELRTIEEGYNLKFGGSHGVHSAKTKMSLSGKNNGMYGRTWTEERKNAHSAKVKAYWASMSADDRAEHRKAVSAARLGRPHPHKGAPRKGIRWARKTMKVRG